MEKSIVKFIAEDDKVITISLEYDKATNDLDYNIKFDERYDMNAQQDFNTFLASMFLNSLSN